MPNLRSNSRSDVGRTMRKNSTRITSGYGTSTQRNSSNGRHPAWQQNSQVNQRRTHQGAQPRGPRTNYSHQRSSNSYHLQPSRQIEEPEITPQRLPCHNCGELNHLTWQCRFDYRIKCNICGEFGHKTKLCALNV